MPLPRALRWIGISLAGIVAALCVAVLVLALIGRARLNRSHSLPPGLTAIPGDSSALARGEHILRIHGCQECHGEDLRGQVFLDIPLGRIVAPNLTRGHGGVGATYRAEDWDHAVRFGVRPDHTSLVPVMPYRLFNHLSDADAAALIAYLIQLPPIDNLLPPTTVRLPGYVVVGMGGMEGLFGRLGQPPSATPLPGTAAYGAYLASTICVECHGEHLQGGKHPAPDAPPAPSLVPVAYWSQPAFAAAVRTGIAPGNRKLSDWMPSQRLKYLTDEEIQALYAYLQTLRGT
jgi:cytochrome c553